MCGIVGILNYKQENFVSVKLLECMLDVINHRGPDERGIYLNKNLGLGNVRLSILDLETGQQPQSDSSQNYWIVFNGEIFNYYEIKNELQNHGYSFITQSDTEVIVAAYSIWGLNFLSKLNGQFSFAIWDKKKQELLLARDRVGICPLFYTENNGSFIFGSEIKAILQHPEIVPKLSITSLCQIFTCWSTLNSATLLNDIKEVPPGHYLKIGNGEVQLESYWKLDFSEDFGSKKINIRDAGEKLKQILTDSVRIRLNADVPVAAYLSGGIDSTAITALINKIAPGILNTFSVGFSDQEFDETVYQQEVSTFFHTNHKSLKCTNEEIADVFPQVVWHSENPMLRSAPAPMYNLSKFVRQNNIKVVLTGEGADEMLAGYDIFKEMAIRRFWACEPNSKYRSLLLKKLYPYIPQIKDANIHTLKFFYGFKLEDVKLPYYSHIMRWNNGKHLLKYLHPLHNNIVSNFDPFTCWIKHKPHNFDNWNNLGKAQYIESTTFMSGYLLSTQSDRMTMANSVEGRYPFLDHRLIEFACQLPENFKMSGLNEKYILKKIMVNEIPHSVLNRKKQAYRAPIRNSFFGKKNIDYIESLTNAQTISNHGVFNPLLTTKLFEKARSNENMTEIDNMAICAIISTQLFLQMFVTKQFPLSDTKVRSSLRLIEEV
ncbi:MAG: asparagine synthase (glutamine-hydrolyzing) [Bacteroidales bacterium]|nr:asparagine synthase (glutamine-hydrolyzing) [Bacteroidales bacterium]